MNSVLTRYLNLTLNQNSCTYYLFLIFFTKSIYVRKLHATFISDVLILHTHILIRGINNKHEWGGIVFYLIPLMLVDYQ